MNAKRPKPQTPDLEEFRTAGTRAIARTQSWIERSAKYPTDRAAALLAEVLKDPGGLDYTVAFVDGVVRPEDLHVAADNLHKLGKFKGAGNKSLSFLPAYLRLPAKIGGSAATLIPEVAVPAARKVFARLVGDLVVDVSDKNLGAAIARLRKDGARLNMNLLGEAVLGQKEADRRLNDTLNLLRRDDVDYVSLKVSAVTGPHNPWGYDAVVNQAVKALMPIYEFAASSPTGKFVNLDMEEYRDLHLTIDVFKQILNRPEMKKLPAGIVLQAYLPDALEAMIELQEWAAKRVSEGGAPIKVRVVKGANLAMERVDASVHGWPLTTEPSKQATDANYLRVLDYCLTPERTKNVRIGVAGHNLYTLAFAYELGLSRNIGPDGMEFEMLSGMAAPQAAAIREDISQLLFYVPVVHPEEYDVAIAYLVRRLEENAASENFMSAIFDLVDDSTMREREQARFEAALADAFIQKTGPNRTQNRGQETEAEIASTMKDAGGNWIFTNTADSDPCLPGNREWARAIASRMRSSKLGADIIAAHRIESAEELDQVIANAEKAAKEWLARPLEERADIIHRVGVKLGLRRGDLIEVAGSEAGKAVDQGDVEVSEAIDFAHYYAEQAKELAQIQGAAFTPARITAVIPPWNFPMAIPAGGCLAALAAGTAVIFKPAAVSKRTGALLASIMWEAGIPEDLLALVDLSDRTFGKQLVCDPRIDQVVLTGSIDTARLFRSWRPDLHLMAETSGKNSIIVTPTADLDLAVKDVVYSAFGHAGQKCSASSLVILVGSVARSRRFRNQLLDAVKSLHVSQPWDLATQMGPLAEPAEGKLLRGLTKLGAGETWAIRPRQIDTLGKQWTPGVRAGVKPDSEYHLTEYFGPILGIMTAKTLEEAIEYQNATAYGLTAGLHSLDSEEINYWLDNVAAGNCYINRGITGAIVQRQPFGGWKRSAVGSGTKAGGPSYLYGFGTWSPAPLNSSAVVRPLREEALAEAAKAASTLPAQEREITVNSLVNFDDAIANEFGVGHDPSQLGVEKNVLRYRPVPVGIRLGADEPAWKALLLVAGGLAVGSKVTISCGSALPTGIREYFDDHDVAWAVEDQGAFLARVASWSAECGEDGRLRLVGEDSQAVSEAINGSVDVAIWSNPLTQSGRVELLPFVHEQAVSFTNHRFGNPTPLGEEVVI